MREVIEHILSANPYKVELSIVDYQDEGIKLEVFLLDDEYQVVEVFTAAKSENNSISDMANIMDKLCQRIQAENIICECINVTQKC